MWSFINVACHLMITILQQFIALLLINNFCFFQKRKKKFISTTALNHDSIVSSFSKKRKKFISTTAFNHDSIALVMMTTTMTFRFQLFYFIAWNACKK